jgi:hypothetical protein
MFLQKCIRGKRPALSARGRAGVSHVNIVLLERERVFVKRGRGVLKKFFF